MVTSPPCCPQVYEFGTVTGNAYKALSTSAATSYAFKGLSVGATTIYACAVSGWWCCGLARQQRGCSCPEAVTRFLRATQSHVAAVRLQIDTLGAMTCETAELTVQPPAAVSGRCIGWLCF